MASPSDTKRPIVTDSPPPEYSESRLGGDPPVEIPPEKSENLMASNTTNAGESIQTVPSTAPATSTSASEHSGGSHSTGTHTPHQLHEHYKPRGSSGKHQEHKADSVTDVPPPAYSDVGNYKNVAIEQDGFSSKAEVLDDGRIDIRINQRSRNLSNIFLPALQRQLTLSGALEQPQVPPLRVPSTLQGRDVARMNIVIQIIGSRGDIQPFIALGLKLHKNPPYHRIRIATHPVFKDFVEESGLEFFSAGGDPAELMAFMVKNPGLVPGLESLKQGEIGKRRKAMYEMFSGFWRSCIEAGDGMSFQGLAVPEPHEHSQNDVFVADAIIANPPSFAHIHCAEKLGIPLHLMFTMPWTPTQSFPHPLANIRSSNTDANITNFLTYTLVEMLTWQGLGDLINRFREKTLDLEPVSMMWAPGMISRLKVPQTYCWSPALIPKPKDWGQHIRISGFYFLDLANNYQPADDLAEFLAAGPPPVYIGFGSIVVDDPNALTTMIFETVRKTGIRALVSKGWGGLGGAELQPPDGVFMLGNCPHDWLFKRVSCVVHHGGAGTTAIGVALGRPTVIVPFFGDQPFWGDMVARAGAGPKPVPFKKLTSDILAESIQTALTPEAQRSAEVIASKIKQEDGAQTGADSFHASLASIRVACMADPSRTAVWRVKRTEVTLSALAATTLVEAGLLEYSDLKLHRHMEWDTDDGPIEPISGATSALLGTFGSVMMGVGDFPREVFKAFKQSDKKGKEPESTDNSSTSSIHDTSSVLSKGVETESSRSSLSIEKPLATPTSEISSNPTNIDDPDFKNGTSDIPLSASQSKESLERNLTASTASTVSTAASSMPALLTESQPSMPSRSNSATPSNFHGRMSAMAQAMQISGHRSRSRSVSPTGAKMERSGSRNKLHKERPEPSRHDSMNSSASRTPSQAGTVSMDMITGAGKGAGRIAEALLRSPMDFSVSLAQGFHNAPRLYGDEVRRQEKIRGVQSGFKVAGKEFAYGLYDGISGLVTHPVKGAKEEGVSGFFKGFGKGIGGVALKPGAAIFGLYGYTFKGVYEELKRMRGNDVESYILAARTAQGYQDFSTSSITERDMIIKRWNALGVERIKRRRKAEEKKKAKQEKRVKPKKRKCATFGPPSQRPSNHDSSSEDSDVPPDTPGTPKTPGTTRADSFAQSRRVGSTTHHSIFPNSDIEESIQQAVKQTSRGDDHEDALIEAAIRESINSIQESQKDLRDDDTTMRMAIEASLASTGGEQDLELRRAITESLEHHGSKMIRDEDPLRDQPQSKPKPPPLPARSSNPSYQPQPHTEEYADDEYADSDNEEFALALQQSLKDEDERQRKEKEEESIILNYVKQASLAEEKFKNQQQQNEPQQQQSGQYTTVVSNTEGNSSPPGESPTTKTAADQEAEDMERAIRESLEGGK